MAAPVAPACPGPRADVPQPDFAGPVAAGDGAIRGHGKASHLIAVAGHARDLLAIVHGFFKHVFVLDHPATLVLASRPRGATEEELKTIVT